MAAEGFGVGFQAYALLPVGPSVGDFYDGSRERFALALDTPSPRSSGHLI